jgi:hypothetical protein
LPYLFHPDTVQEFRNLALTKDVGTLINPQKINEHSWCYANAWD